MDTAKGLAIDVELDVSISVLPYTGCYISRINSYDDRHDFFNIYNLNDLLLDDQRLIKVRMSTDHCNNIGVEGISVDIKDLGERFLVGDKCNYIPYQLIKDCKDGDKFTYIITLPYKINVLLNITCQQELDDEYEFDNLETSEMFKKFNTAVLKCKNDRLIV